MSEKYNPRPVSEWKISKKAKLIVAEELQQWIMMLVDKAQGATGNVYNFDVIKDDIFYFTDCRDIIGKTGESKDVETDLNIRRRKRAVFCQLLLKQILDGPIHKKISPCTHCGHNNRLVSAFPDLGGHFYYCPDCGKTDICTYPKEYHKIKNNVEQVLKNKGLIDNDTE